MESIGRERDFTRFVQSGEAADKLGEVDEPGSAKGENASKELLEAGANTSTKATIPNLKVR